jgi:hypothetical protein
MARAGANPIFRHLALFEISDLCFARLEPQRLLGVLSGSSATGSSFRFAQPEVISIASYKPT